MTGSGGTSGSVVVGMATTASAPYIARSMRKLVPELRGLVASRTVTLAVCLNGPDPHGVHLAALRAALADLAGEVAEVAVHVIVREPAGKSGALGVLVDYARSIGAPYFLFPDDDLNFAPGTLVKLVDGLAAAPTDRPVLVGPRTLALPQPLRSFLARMPLRKALVAWWWQSVFRLPYEPASEFFLFSPGGCSAIRVSDYPALPPEDSGITDDAYLNYKMVADGGLILQPQGAAMYFIVSCDYEEWIGQQLRVLAGIEKTLALFADHADEIRRVFAWPYSHNKEARLRPARCRTPRRLILLIAYRYAQADLLRRYRTLSGTPEWGRAESTKQAFLHH